MSVRSSVVLEPSKVTKQFVAGISASLAIAAAGFHFGWSSPSLLKLQAADSDLPLTSDQGSWVVSAFTIGCALGPLIGCLLVDSLGRKWSLLISALPYIVACTFIAFGNHYWWLLSARLVAGIGSGMSYTASPMYLGEIADDRIRGALGAMINQMLNAGILITYCVGPWVSRQILALVGGIFPVIFLLVFVWMPESPYYWLTKNKTREAEQSLIWLKGKEDVTEDLKLVERSVEFDRQNSGTYKELVTIPGNRKALVVIVGLVCAQQLSGIGAVLAYSSLIFDASGAELNASFSVIIVGAIQVLGGILTIFTVDLAGRRPLLLLSTFGSIVCLSGEALYFQLQSLEIDVSSISWLPVTAVVGYILSYTFGLGCLPYVVLSEIFPYNVKAKASMVTAIFGALGAVVVTKLYQVIADAYGIHVSFWLFAGFSVFSGIFIYLVLPETKQRSLRDIQDEFQNVDSSSPPRFKDSEAP